MALCTQSLYKTYRPREYFLSSGQPNNLTQFQLAIYSRVTTEQRSIERRLNTSKDQPVINLTTMKGSENIFDRPMQNSAGYREARLEESNNERKGIHNAVIGDDSDSGSETSDKEHGFKRGLFSRRRRGQDKAIADQLRSTNIGDAASGRIPRPGRLSAPDTKPGSSQLSGFETRKQLIDRVQNRGGQSHGERHRDWQQDRNRPGKEHEERPDYSGEGYGQQFPIEKEPKSTRRDNSGTN